MDSERLQQTHPILWRLWLRCRVTGCTGGHIRASGFGLQFIQKARIRWQESDDLVAGLFQNGAQFRITDPIRILFLANEFIKK